MYDEGRDLLPMVADVLVWRGDLKIDDSPELEGMDRWAKIVLGRVQS